MANLKVSWNIFFLIFATAPVLPAVVKENGGLCSRGEVPCDDGSCVDASRLCDGAADCSDRSDEARCAGVDTLTSLWYPDLNRSKRQTSSCRKSQWQCRDKSCISFDGKCDGVVDCPDGSDETHPLCRSERCQPNWFRCTYGACVDGTAPCNGLQECADSSDELLPRCRNETDEIRGQFRCLNGDIIPAASHCDGVADCADRSDETVRACAAKTCPSYLFQCAYGACVDSGADCNGVQECADNSDESDELCNRISAPTTTTTQRPVQTGKCILPPYPDHGGYVVQGALNASPGQAFPSLSLNVTCHPGYGVEGESQLLCFDGFWVSEMPKCIRYCRLPAHPSVEYRCLLRGGDGVEGSRPCRDYEPRGTVVRPECRKPNYYSAGVLGFMHCAGDSWDYVAVCTPGLLRDGTNITILVRGRVEVHVGVFRYAAPVETGSTRFNQVDAGPVRPTPVRPIMPTSTVEPAAHMTQAQPVRPVKPPQPVQTLQPSTESSDYEIDQADWRIGVASNLNASNIEILFKNGTVNVKTDDGVINFRD
ncbi:unnamed protein product, partial [Iphiclides podalirius]